MSEQIDKARLLAYMAYEVNKLPKGMMDGVMAKRISTVKGAYDSVKQEVESGSLNIEPMEHERAYWAREGLIKKLQADNESLKAITELAVKALETSDEISRELHSQVGQDMDINPSAKRVYLSIIQYAGETVIAQTLAEIERLSHAQT